MSLNLNAQNWAPLGKGFDTEFLPETMVADTIQNRLICGGRFKWINSDSVIGQGIAVWNGNVWDSLGYRIQVDRGNNGCDPVTKLFWFKDTLYADGQFFDPSFTYPTKHGKYNTVTKRWENLTNCYIPSPFNNPLNNDTLIFNGGYDTICGLPKSMAFFYDGYNFHTVQLSFADLMQASGNSVRYLFRFKGVWYAAGTFNNSSTNSVNCFLEFNGTNWVPVPGSGAIATNGAGSLKIFNNELYISGPFFKSQGAPGNGIVKFDGINWDDLSGGISSVSGDLNDQSSWFANFTVHKGNLYATGYFAYKNDIPSMGIAKYDGTQWCNSGDVFQGQVNDIVFLNDTLYVDGGFTAIGTQPIKGVAKRLNLNFTGNCLTAGINDVSETNGIAVYPNPVNGILNISSKNNSLENSMVEISNSIGQTVLSLGYTPAIDISGLPPGYYLIRIRAANTIHTAKFIKE